MDDVEKFIRCPGILKNSIVKNYENASVIEPNFCAFSIQDDNEPKIILIKWKDDLTISMKQTGRSILLELWKSGKRVQGKKWNKEVSFGIFTACMNFYEIEDHLQIESNSDPNLQEFLFS